MARQGCLSSAQALRRLSTTVSEEKLSLEGRCGWAEETTRHVYTTRNVRGNARVEEKKIEGKKAQGERERFAREKEMEIGESGDEVAMVGARRSGGGREGARSVPFKFIRKLLPTNQGRRAGFDVSWRVRARPHERATPPC